METFKYRDRLVTESDIVFINRLIAEYPDASRRALSEKLCKAWNWVQPNGQLKDMVCRSFMLKLHREGVIELPPPRFKTVNNVTARHRRQRFLIDSSPIAGRLAEVGKLEFRGVRRTGEEKLYDSLIEEHHYLGYAKAVGEHLKYLVYARRERPIACFGWTSAWRSLGLRDRFIGWCPEARKRNIRYLAYNSRFLILPWVTVPHLASHLLGRMAKRISADWEQIYGHPVYYLESFVDTERFEGTSYRAANWLFLGKSSGCGTRSLTSKKTVSVKEVLGYPLRSQFRELLCSTLEKRG